MLSEFTLASLFCILYMIWHVITTEQRRKFYNYIPGPYDFPLIGSLLQLAAAAGISGTPHERLSRVCRRYGSVVSAKAASFPLIIVENPEMIKEVLNSPDWSDRFPDLPRFKEQTMCKNLGLAFSSGAINREIKKFTVKTLRHFGFGESKTSEELIQREIDALLAAINVERELCANEVFMHHKFKVPTFNVLWFVMAGSRFDHKDSKIETLIHAVEECAKIGVGLDPEWIFPILRIIPGCSPSRALMPNFFLCHKFFIDLLNERRLKGTYSEIQNDFVDYFLHKIDQEKGNTSTLYTDEQFIITCVDLFFGGIETTSNSLEFAILYMTKFPRVQKKVQAEIDALVGSDRRPSNGDRQQLKYVEAVLLETLRYACVIPLNCRTACCDTKVGSYNVLKGTFCGLNVTSVHMNKKVWGDPEDFRPERFLNESNDIVNADKIFPFGGGKRLCPGYIMAKVKWFLFFTALMQRYNFSPSPSHPTLSLVPIPGMANLPKPFHCLVTPRFLISENCVRN